MAEREESCEGRFDVCERRFNTLAKRKKWNSTESLLGGIIGGIAAIIGSWAFWKGTGP
jgi:hypothetical protein